MADNDTVIVAAAFCPQPPLLHPDVLGPAGLDMGAALRSACVDALGRILAADPDAVLVLGSAEDSPIAKSEREAVTATPSSAATPDARSGAPAYGRGDAGDLMGYGVPLHHGFDGPPSDTAARLPLPHLLAAWLLDEAGFTGQRLGVHAEAGSPDLQRAHADDRRWAMLVMGDGSARRTEKSPGWYDPDAIGFDERLTTALSSGDGRALLDLDQSLGERMLAAGRTSWHTAGTALAGTPMVGQLHYADAPFGVFYVVASWVRQA